MPRVCPPAGVSPPEAGKPFASPPSGPPASGSARSRQLGLGIAQGGFTGSFDALIAELTGLDFDGYALRWPLVGEPRPELLTRSPRSRRCYRRRNRATSWESEIPGILEVIARGIDMFDCVLPTRLGRTGTALTSHGRLKFERAVYATATARRALRWLRARGSRARTSATSSTSKEPPAPALSLQTCVIC